MMSEINHSGPSWMLSEQADHGPEQIKSPDELVVGVRFQYEYPHIHHEMTQYTFEVTKVLPNGWVELIYVDCPHGELRHKSSLSGMGVVPFGESRWNTNWIRRVEASETLILNDNND